MKLLSTVLMLWGAYAAAGNIDDTFAAAKYIIDDGPEQLLDKTRWSCSNPASSTIVDGALRLDQRERNGGFFNFKDKALLGNPRGNVCLEIDMKILSTPDTRNPMRLFLGFAAGTPGEHCEPILLLSNTHMGGSFDRGYPALPLDERFKLRVLLDLKSKQARLYANERLIKEKQVGAVTTNSPYLSFGNGSASIGGVIEISKVRVGIFTGDGGVFAAADREPPFFLPWQETVIGIGTEKDGYADEIKGEISFTDPAATDGIARCPYLEFVPEKNLLLLLFSRVGRDSSSRMISSSDNAATWSKLDYPGGAARGYCYGITNCGDGVFIMTNGNQRSTDYGKTWQDFPQPHLPRFNSRVFGWERVCVVPGTNGKHILCPGFFSHFHNEREAKSACVIRESFDAGATWSDWRGLPEFLNSNEISMIGNGKGGLAAAIRNTSIPGTVNDQPDRLEASFSSDNGKTWSAPKVIAGNGCHQPSLALLPDGKIVCSYVVRLGYPTTAAGYGFGIEAIVSHDGGVTWDTRHRYVLARWNHKSIFRKNGQMVKMERFHAAPQGTSTVYLPQTGEVLTAYCAPQFATDIDANEETTPTQVALVKWKPLNADQFSDRKLPPPAPVAVEKALKEVRECPRFAINYVSSTGYPDAGWVDRYPGGAAKMVNGKLRMDNRGLTRGLFSTHGADRLELMNDSIVMKMRVNVLPVEDPGKSESLTLCAIVGNGDRRHMIAVFVTPEAKITGSLGNLNHIKTKPGTPFTFEAHIDPRAEHARVWIDGVLVSDQRYKVNYTEEKYAACFYFGISSPRTGGAVELEELKMGEANR